VILKKYLLYHTGTIGPELHCTVYLGDRKYGMHEDLGMGI